MRRPLRTAPVPISKLTKILKILLSARIGPCSPHPPPGRGLHPLSAPLTVIGAQLGGGWGGGSNRGDVLG